MVVYKDNISWNCAIVALILWLNYAPINFMPLYGVEEGHYKAFDQKEAVPIVSGLITREDTLNIAMFLHTALHCAC